MRFEGGRYRSRTVPALHLPRLPTCRPLRGLPGVLGARDPGATLAALAHPGLNSAAATRLLRDSLSVVGRLRRQNIGDCRLGSGRKRAFLTHHIADLRLPIAE